MTSQLYKDNKALLLLAIIASLMISLWGNIVDDVINNDGIEYIKSAQSILQGDWALAFETFKWPFYSAVVAIISKISTLSLTNSALAFNALCYAWMVVAFIALVRALGGDKQALWFAALIILAFPTINKFRPYVIRDPAFYALFLSGCYAFFLYLKDSRQRYNILSIFCFILAALFRVEGVIYLFVTQAYLLARHVAHQHNRWLNAIIIVAALASLIILLSWWQFSPTEELSYLSIFTHPSEFFTTAWMQVIEQIESRLRTIESRVLVGYSRSYSTILLLWSALTIVLAELMHSLYYLYFILGIVAWRKGLLFPAKNMHRPWRFIISVALTVLLGFVLVKWFLSARYPITVSLLVLLATPFLLSHWYHQLTSTGRRSRWYWVVLSLIVLSGVKSFDLATKKHYLTDASHWMRENIPAGATVYTNNRIVAHYFARDITVDNYWRYWKPFKTSVLLARQRFDYAAINIKHENRDFFENTPILINRKLIAEYINEKGSKVLIFNLKQGREKQSPAPFYSD